MLDERKALSFRYDAARDIVRVGFEHTRDHAASRTFPSSVEGTLLLDAGGFLVGVDLGAEGTSRAVVMLGPHEAVASQVESSLVIARVGSLDGYELHIPSARAQIRGDLRNPYVR